MKKIKKICNPADFDADVEKKFQIYSRPYMGYTDLACVLDVSPRTAKRLVEETNKVETKIRRFNRIGMPTSDVVKAFGLEANRKQITTLRTSHRTSMR